MIRRIPIAPALLLSTALPATAQNTFDLNRPIAATPLPPALLTEGFPGPPVGAIPLAAMGLTPADEVDALSFGDDFLMQTVHALVFSVDRASVGATATGVDFEFTVDTAPGAPPSAAGDLFLQDFPGTPGNVLAPPTVGYDAGTLTGDESNATWMSPCAGVACDDLDAFDHSPPAVASGLYFSLGPGSPALAAIGATPGDILYSDLSGAPPVIATLAGAGPATAANLGIPGMDLDALNVVGTTGPIGSGGGVIGAGPVGPSIGAPPPPPATHLVQFSVASLAGTGGGADVLVRVAAGAFAVHSPAGSLGLLPTDDLNALEAVQGPPVCPPAAATVFFYNGTGINLDRLTTSTAVLGSVWTATLAPQATRGPGSWVVLLRSTSAAGPVLDLGLLFTLPPAGLSELLVGAGVLGTFAGPPHLGGGTTASLSVAVPPSCTLSGIPWFAQAVVTGDLPAGAGVLDPWFSTAAGGLIGTF